MKSIQVKNVPEETHRVLTERAAQSHQSLQEYLLSKLVADAQRPTVEEVFKEVASNSGGAVSFDDAAEIVRHDRDRR